MHELYCIQLVCSLVLAWIILLQQLFEVWLSIGVCFGKKQNPDSDPNPTLRHPIYSGVRYYMYTVLYVPRPATFSVARRRKSQGGARG